jgi:hypothetical protein
LPWRDWIFEECLNCWYLGHSWRWSNEFNDEIVTSLWGPGVEYYGLNMKCPPEAHVLNTIPTGGASFGWWWTPKNGGGISRRSKSLCPCWLFLAPSSFLSFCHQMSGVCHMHQPPWCFPSPRVYNHQRQGLWTETWNYESK